MRTPVKSPRKTKPRATAAADSARAHATEVKDFIAKVLDDGKAENIVAIDLAGRTSIADYMIVASGRSNRHVAALAEQVAEDLKKSGLGKAKLEGLPQADWVLIDAGEVIAHVFRPEVREFYNLEKMWTGERPKDVSEE
jgi:ribosome-associated protein